MQLKLGKLVPKADVRTLALAHYLDPAALPPLLPAVNWSDAVSALLQEVYYAQIAPRRLPEGGSEEVRRIAAALPRPRVVSAIEAMRALRSALEQNVNRPIALEALFLKLVGLP